MAKRIPPEEYRKSLKDKILIVAKEMFRNSGFKLVKMDNISQALGISKRTLYEIYPNKEEIIMETVRMDLEETHKAFEKLEEEKADTMDILTKVFSLHIQETKNMNPVIFEDLQAYPKILNFLREHRESNEEKSKQFFMRGQKEGYFLKDVNLDLIHILLVSHFDVIMQKELFRVYSPTEIMYVSILLGMRGLCTMKGIERLDEILGELLSRKSDYNGDISEE